MEKMQAKNNLKRIYNFSKSVIKLTLRSKVLEDNIKEKMLVEAYFKAITERMDKVIAKMFQGDNKPWEVEYFVLYKLISSIVSQYNDKTDCLVCDDCIKEFIRYIDGIKIRKITDMFDKAFKEVIPNKKYLKDMTGDVIYISLETSHGDFDYTLSFDNLESKLLDLKVNFKVKAHSTVYGDLTEN